MIQNRTTTTVIGKQLFKWGARTYVMGVLNMTTDSFSGDGVVTGDEPTQAELQKAIGLALRMEDEGADLIDIGGESTRPPSVYGAVNSVTTEVEKARVVPLIAKLSTRLGVPISIDTRHSQVAKDALRAGAVVVNDISMLSDVDMAATARAADALIVGHWRGRAQYSDLLEEVIGDLKSALARAVKKGVEAPKLVADPGIGFGKNPQHNLRVLRGLAELKQRVAVPIAIGTSRKSFIGRILGLPFEERLEGTAATTALAVANGVDIVRAHDVLSVGRIARMCDAVVRGWDG